MKKKVLIAGFSLILLQMVTIGCQTVPYQGQARNVKLRPGQEGVLGLPLSQRPEDRNKAVEAMKMNCSPSDYKVIEEGEVVVGQETKRSQRETDRQSSEQTVGKLFGIPLTTGEAGGKDVSGSEVTTAVKEWQISYKCLASDSGKKKSKVE